MNMFLPEGGLLASLIVQNEVGSLVSEGSRIGGAVEPASPLGGHHSGENLVDSVNNPFPPVENIERTSKVMEPKVNMFLEQEHA